MMRNRTILSSIFILVVLLSFSLPGLCGYELFRMNKEGGNCKQLTHLNSRGRVIWVESPAGDLLAVGTSGRIQIINWDGEVINTYIGEETIQYLPTAWNEQGIYAYANDNQQAKKLVLIALSDTIVDKSSFQQIDEWDLYTEKMPTISPDEKYLVFAKKIDSQHIGYLLDLTTRKSIKIGSINDIPLVNWSPDSKLFTFFDKEGNTSIFDLNGNKIYDLRSTTYSLAWSPDGKYLVNYNNYKSQLDIFDFKKKKVIKSIDATIAMQANWAKDSKNFIFTEMDIKSADGKRRVRLGDINGNTSPVINESTKLSTPVWASNDNYIIVSKFVEESISFKPSGQYDFRKTNWGMSQNEVMKAEDCELNDKLENIISYKASMFGPHTYIMYVFAKDKLINAGYVFMQKKDESSFANYDLLKNKIIAEYGQPGFTKFFHNGEEYTGNADLTAILQDGVEYVTVWKGIFLLMKVTDGDLGILAGYTDPKLFQ